MGAPTWIHAEGTGERTGGDRWSALTWGAWKVASELLGHL